MLQEILHFFGGAICHQLEDRTLLVSGKTLSVCARCTGIYIGIFSTLVYLHLVKKKSNITIPSIKISFLLLLLFVPLMVDGLGSYMHVFESTNARRLLTGISFGFVLPYFLYPLLPKKALDRTSLPVINQSQDILIPFSVSVIIGGLVFLGKLPYFILDSLIVGTIILWFSLCASFLCSRLQSIALKWIFSSSSGLVFLSILALFHKLAVP